MKNIVFIIGIMIVALGSAFLLFGDNQNVVVVEPNEQVISEIVEVEQKSGKLIEFSGKEFKDLYDSLSLPNTVPIIIAPQITGVSSVDKHIQEIAEKRGYSLREVPGSDLSSISSIELQQLLIEDWAELKKAAKKDGINLEIVSGYRSIEEQTDIFLSRLNLLGYSNHTILSGAIDSQINEMLRYTAPPGYSRHHSGYTIDIADESAPVFEYSKGYQWISKNNYENAKKFGFIPSYPDDAKNQGPDPEPWEYVWANKDFVIE